MLDGDTYQESGSRVRPDLEPWFAKFDPDPILLLEPELMLMQSLGKQSGGSSRA